MAFDIHQICALRLENFKPYGGRAIIPMAPITLIFGENSSGKSSILQALHLLKQTHENRNTDDILTPRAESGIVDLGSFPELVFDHEVSRKLKIRIDFDCTDYTHWRISPTKEPETSRYSSIEKIDGVELHFEYSADRRTVSLCQLEIFNNKVGLIARFQKREDVSWDPEILNILQSLDFYLENTAYNRSQYFGGRNPDPHNFLCNTYITDSEEFWLSPFESVKNKREQIVQCLNTRRRKLINNGRSSIDSRGVTHAVWGNYSVTFYRDQTDAEADINAEKYASEWEILGLEKAIKFYSCEFSLDDFISRMQTEQRSDTLAAFGMLELRYSGGFPGLFPEYYTTKDSGISHESIRSVCDFAIQSINSLKSTLDAVLSIGPHRSSPDRFYTFTGKKPQDVGLSGKFLPDLLFQNPDLVNTTNKWLKHLGIGYLLKIEQHATHYLDLYEIRFLDERREDTVDVNLRDMGFGISQILPLVVQCLACYGKVITIQQPELHIHPSLQANLGDIFVESAYKRRNQLIIETHSEHLILRMQKLVRTGKLNSDDVSILYVSRDSSGSFVERLRLDESGEFIDDWPGGFFSERLDELF